MISFLIPTYNEFQNIDIIVNEIKQLNLDFKFKIFFVDDDSKDGSIYKFTKLRKENDNIDFYIRKNTKKDLTRSILDSLKFIDSKYILVMDCDLQHDITSIRTMCEMIIKKNYDLVIGSRDLKKLELKHRKLTSTLGTFVIKLIGIKEFIDPLSGFFIIKTEKFKLLAPKINTKGFKILLSILFYGKNILKITEIKTNFYKRKYEKSKLNTKVIYLFIIQIIKLIISNNYK